ncbi:Phosphatidylserine decarboxylase proenzyme [Candidatus Zixiibacteriota bacterium]|nr:Phosphatidylserine decarboxylase proenzyme [candidate division Zixibacteria bacterium]
MIVADGLKFIIGGLILTIAFALFAAGKDSITFLIIAVIFAVMTLFLTFFYRNPARRIPTDDNLILSIADGTVLSVQDIDNAFIGGKGKKVSIFLSVFNVHVNRTPAAGQIEYANYNPGKFFAAFEDKASKENEQTEIGLSFKAGKMIFKQIAGILARRVVCNLKAGQAVSAGELFGLIHFGSRAELFLPDNIEIMVKKGDKVKGGETVIGRIMSAEEGRL